MIDTTPRNKEEVIEFKLVGEVRKHMKKGEDFYLDALIDWYHRMIQDRDKMVKEVLDDRGNF